MANNEYVNKVEFGNQVVMDITDTTAEAGDVIEDKVFYAKSGARSVGTLGDATQSTHGLMSTTDKIKLDGIDLLGVKLNSTALLPDANGYVNIPVMTGATSNANGSVGLVPAPTSADIDKFLAGDGTYKSGGLPMVILSYGNSTWDDFITAYNNNVIVYCRASSNSNPATGSQTRMAFMAYVNNATTPTEVEFQYYRSMSSHSATAMGDQVFVYKITNKGVWSVTTRDASIKEINVESGSKLGVSWSSNKVTLSNTMTAADMPMSSSDATTVSSAISDNSQAIANVNTTAVVTALTDIPVNTKGRIRLDASISPTGVELLANYINVGSSSRQTIIVDANTAGRTFINSRQNDSVWTGWQELALKSDLNPELVTTNITDTVANGYTTTATYHGYIALTGVLTGWGIFEVTADTVNGTTVIEQTATTAAGVAVRHKEGSTWGTWKTLALNSNVGIQKHGRGSVAWGSNVEITRPTNASMLIFGGRQGYTLMLYIPENTNERVNIATTAISAVTITSTKVTLTAASSGYGSTMSYEYLIFA